MGLTRTIFWNTFIQVGGRAISTLLALVVFGIMTRALGPADFGVYATVVAFLQFFSIIVDFGLTLTANRLLGEIPFNPPLSKGEVKGDFTASRLMSNLMTLRFFSALFCLILAPLIAYAFFPYTLQIKQGMFILAASFFAIIMTQTLTPVFQKNLRMGKVATAEIAGRVVLLAGIILCAGLKLPLFAYFVAIVLASAANYFILRILAIPFVRLKFAFDFSLWRRVVALSWPIGISIIFNLVYLKTDTIILSVLRSSTEVGFYGAAYKVLDILTGLATMFMGLVMPVMVAAWVGGERGKFARLLQRSFEAILFAALPVVIISVLLGQPIMALVAGQAFVFSGQILAVLILAMAAVFFSTLFGHTVVVINKQKSMILGYAADAVLSLIGYFIFIPRFGIWGAAWVTVFSEVLIALITYWVVWKNTRAVLDLKNAGKAIVGALVASAAIILTKDVSWIVSGVVGLAVYGISLYISGAVSRKTINEIFSFKEKVVSSQ